MSSLTATPGEVAKEAAAAGGAAAAEGAKLPAMALAKLVTTVVSTAICYTNSAFDGTLPALFVLGVHD